jgi:hypothetical protein
MTYKNRYRICREREGGKKKDETTRVCKQWKHFEISGSYGGEYEDGCLLGCSAV